MTSSTRFRGLGIAGCGRAGRPPESGGGGLGPASGRRNFHRSLRPRIRRSTSRRSDRPGKPLARRHLRPERTQRTESNRQSHGLDENLLLPPQIRYPPPPGPRAPNSADSSASPMTPRPPWPPARARTDDHGSARGAPPTPAQPSSALRQTGPARAAFPRIVRVRQRADLPVGPRAGGVEKVTRTNSILGNTHHQQPARRPQTGIDSFPSFSRPPSPQVDRGPPPPKKG